jgi:hypothetical protein
MSADARIREVIAAIGGLMAGTAGRKHEAIS